MIYKHERPKSSAGLMQEWLVEAANELADAHQQLDVAGVPRVNPEEGGVEFTLAARIFYLTESRESDRQDTKPLCPGCGEFVTQSYPGSDLAGFVRRNGQIWHTTCAISDNHQSATK